MKCTLLVVACAILVLAPRASLAQEDVVECDAPNTVIEYCDQAETIVQVGSSTVYPLAKLYQRFYSDEIVFPTVGSSGSSLGFLNLLSGNADIALASRALASKDYTAVGCDGNDVRGGIASAECQGISPQGIQVGSDMIAVFVHPNNMYVDSLTSDQLGQLFSGSVAWGDVISGAPNVVPNLYIADPLSGTFDFFESASGTRLPREGGYSDDVSLLAGAKNDENALGFVPLAFVLDSNAVKVVDVDGVDPTTTTNPESYNFFRPLFFYYDENSASSAVKRYICGLMNQDGQRIVTDSGYVQIPQSLISSNVRTLDCSGLSTPTRTYTGINKQFTYCRDMNEITLSGSSTVYPFAQQLAIENPNTWLYPVSGSSSSGVGIRTFLAGATDIGTASRALKDSDYSALGCDPNLVVDSIASGPCQGILPKGAVVGRDMLAVIVNTANPISSAGISSIGLKDIFTGLTTWSSIGTTSRQIPQAVGTATVKYCIPDPLSGTHSFFEDYIGAEITRDVDITFFTSDEEIIDCVASNPNAIGFLGRAFVTDEVVAVSVDGQDPFTDISQYPIARPLYFYYDGSDSGYRKATIEFVCEALSDVGIAAMSKAGYVPLTCDDIELLKIDLGLYCGPTSNTLLRSPIN